MVKPVAELVEFLQGADSAGILQDNRTTGLAELDLVYSTLNIMGTKIQDAEKLKQEMVVFRAVVNATQMVAHDVRKPLVNVKTFLLYLSTVSDRNTFQVFKDRAVPELERTINRVDGILTDIMEVGKDKRKDAIEDLDVRELCEQAVWEVKQSYSCEKVLFHYSHQHTGCLQVNSFRVGRVLVNILMNAVESMSLVGDITIATRDQASGAGVRCFFTVTNSGPKISDKDLPKIFDMFFTSQKKTGRGLGLVISRSIVNEYDGEISCQNTASGVSFCFDLPASSL